jgi:predicted NAD-dependent protein-ADP-ribosyltransferase YbiA (DUF1768 family)
VDWELSLYTLFCAWIVNFGFVSYPSSESYFVDHRPPTSLDPNAPEDLEEAPKPKQAQDTGTEYTKQLQHLIVEAVS